MSHNQTLCLKIGVDQYPGLITLTGEPPNIKGTGVLEEIYDILSKHFGFCYQYVISPGSFGEVLENGTVTGMTGQLNRSVSLFTHTWVASPATQHCHFELCCTIQLSYTEN
ncbi:uncharacterized protein LOC121868976 [Homarus americanus]|uniref:uncharacterized protein LOC121868976 n=1 Tax=Homarus americanus TaxID=6706 RepID=UPI001C443411|nr:uncharacterized protein LOC121868976 [Homarus americanus]